MAAILAALLSQDLLRCLITDIAIEEHRTASLERQYAAYSYPPAPVVPLANSLLAPIVAGARSRASSPSGPSPAKKEKEDTMEECLHCSRSIGAARYASHLSNCMGITGRPGRGESRRAAAGGPVSVGKSGSLSRGGVAQGGYASSDSERAKTNGVKRAATGPATNPAKFKKLKTPSSGSATPTPHLPALPALPSALSTASHPLSKTFSNPVPTPQSTVPAMSARPSLPSQSSTGSAGRPGFASRPVAHASLQSDRPDSDSEEDDSEDERPLARGRQRGTNGHVNGNGIGNGNGSASGNGGGVPQKKPAGAQKAPRKQAPVKKKHPLAHADTDTSAESASDSDDSD